MREILEKLVPTYQEAFIALTACRLDIFNTLANDKLNAADLAAKLNLKPEPAEIFLNALVALGLLSKTKNRYKLTNLSSKYLVRGKPEYRGDLYLHQERMWHKWSELALILSNEAGWESKGEDSEADREFVMAMEANARRLGRKVAGSVELKGVKRLLDLGGGPATYSRFFLNRKPDMKVTVFDRPPIVDMAIEINNNKRWKDSLCFKAGDFLSDEIGEGFDMIWASNVMHSLGPEEAKILLERCFKSLSPGGRLLLHDFFLDGSGTRPKRAAVFSVHMLVATAAGRSYRLREIVRMMEGAGFTDIRTVAEFENTTIIEGQRL